LKIVSVVGARPNFMKLAPVARALGRRPGVRHLVVHTGQHYDPVLSDQLFADLELPTPDHHLGVGSGSQAVQTAAAMTRLESLLTELRPDRLLVYGDVNSTLAAALVGAKLGIPVAHVEAGLRSGDRGMPEEINRLVTDRLCDLLLAPSQDAVDHLRHEGTPADQVHLVGNVMVDSLIAALPRAVRLCAPARHKVAGEPFIVVTLHRPANVDHPATLLELMRTLTGLAEELPVLFPVHPRTRERIAADGLPRSRWLRLLSPLGYLEMLSLVREAAVVITDSGGLQEETTFLGVPCVTVRPSTERPITCTLGTNRLVQAEHGAILAAVRAAAVARPAVPPRIPFWDGQAGERIAGIVAGPVQEGHLSAAISVEKELPWATESSGSSPSPGSSAGVLPMTPRHPG
jgi:UDP-N-acetylglucosamine 2-epimerase (non-hydrolysing)